MNPVVVAILAVTILAVGIGIGVSGITTQYGIDTSGSHAGQLACTAIPTSPHVGTMVQFSVTGLPVGTAFHWASDEGTTELMANGTLSVRYRTAGAKTVFLFRQVAGRWLRMPCSVTVTP